MPISSSHDSINLSTVYWANSVVTNIVTISITGGQILNPSPESIFALYRFSAKIEILLSVTILLNYKWNISTDVGGNRR